MMTFRIAFASLLVLLTTQAAGLAQVETVRFEILPGSQYTYIPSAISPPTDVDGCTVGTDGDLRCDFSITGLFDLQIDPSGPASIVGADLTLSACNFGEVPSLELTTSTGVEEFLEDLSFFSVPSTAATAAFGTNLIPGTVDPIRMVYDTPGLGGILSGGFRERFVFGLEPRTVGPASNLGEGIDFQVNLRRVAASVPEPASVTLLGCVLLLAGFGRRRSVQPVK